jgi:hypothetical protein
VAWHAGESPGVLLGLHSEQEVAAVASRASKRWQR